MRAGVGGVSALATLLCLAASGAGAGESNATRPPASFATARQAAVALVDAFRSEDEARMIDVLGSAGRDLVASGDPVADRQARQRFLLAYDAAHELVEDPSGQAGLRVGPEDWLLPIPIVRTDGRWSFDGAASRQSILDRRVGRNELSVIEVCRAYVAAQREFADSRARATGKREYAARLASSAGAHDGLYWATHGSEAPSPLGPLVAQARAEGYGASEPPGARTPYHGYYFRILTGQGASAPGGARDYLVDGHMTGGFALLAFPAKWGDSGVMTFVVSQDGIVFERNLGEQTERLAREIAHFDPDPGWRAP